MSRFPEDWIFQGINEPVRVELDITDIEVEGELPGDMQGAFYRVGPDWQYPPKLGRDVLFNGDGAVSMFEFHGGRASLKHRYVRTEKFRLERSAGRALYGAYRNPYTDDPSVRGRRRGTANTNIVLHGGALLALKEDSPPVELDPYTLETRGDWLFSGSLTSPTFTAHPKVDPRTGQMIAFGYGVTGLQSPDIAYFEISREGRITHEVRLDIPYFCMVHDFGVTRDYVVFPIIPCVGTGEDALKQGSPFYGWDSQKDVFLGVLPRGGEARDVRWFKAPNQFISHVMNAFNEGTKVHIDVPVCETTLFPWFPDVKGSPFDPTKARPRLTRWTVDFAAKRNTFEESVRLSEFVGEFPRTDARWQTMRYRHGWMLGFGGTRNELAHIDLERRVTKTYSAGDDISVQEPCFVPRSPTAAEGDGYLLQVATHRVTMRTMLFVYDALSIEDGPLARLKLPLRLRPAFHGNWYSTAEIAARNPLRASR